MLALASLAGAALWAGLTGGAGENASSHGLPTINVLPGQPFHPGEFLYTRAISLERLRRPAGGETGRHGYFFGRGPEVAFDIRLSTETWVGADGTMRQRLVVVSERFTSAAGRAQWRAYKQPLPNFAADLDGDAITQGDGLFPPEWPDYDPAGPQDLGDGAFGYRQLVSLPTGAAALRARIEQAWNALEQREAASTVAPGLSAPQSAGERRDDVGVLDLSDVYELLTWPVPVAQRVALFRLATELPGARLTEGRDRVGISATAPRFEPPAQLSYDPATGALLAGPDGTVTAQGIAGSISALPKGVAPIRATGAPPPPALVTLSPAVGMRNTVFKIRVPSPVGLGWGVDGPIYRGCSSSFYPSFKPSSPPPRITFAGDTGRLTPPSATGNAWCPGRYRLTLTALGSSGPPMFGTSVYFEVKG